jgi:nitroreductase
VLEIGDICSAAAATATENMLLAFQALGLATKWRTGEESRDPHQKEILGFPLTSV